MKRPFVFLSNYPPRFGFLYLRACKTSHFSLPYLRGARCLLSVLPCVPTPLLSPIPPQHRRHRAGIRAQVPPALAA